MVEKETNEFRWNNSTPALQPAKSKAQLMTFCFLLVPSIAWKNDDDDDDDYDNNDLDGDEEDGDDGDDDNGSDDGVELEH